MTHAANELHAPCDASPRGWEEVVYLLPIPAHRMVLKWLGVIQAGYQASPVSYLIPEGDI